MAIYMKLHLYNKISNSTACPSSAVVL